MNYDPLFSSSVDALPQRLMPSAWGAVLGAAVLLASPVAAQPFQDDFNDGNDTGWLRFDLTAFLNSEGLAGTWAEYTFPDDGQGGKAYRLQVYRHPVPNDDLAPRAFVYRPEVYTRFRVAADLLDWNTDSDTAIGIVARIQPTIGLGQTSGYLLNLNPSDQDVDITLVTGESPSELSDMDAFLTPARGPYRFEFKGTDDALVGHVYSLEDPRAPVASTATINAAHASGRSGLLVYDDNGFEIWTGVDATYDNYAAEEIPAGSPPEVMLLEPMHLSVSRAIPATLRASLFYFDSAVEVVQNSITFAINGVVVPNTALAITPGVRLNDGEWAGSSAYGLTVEYTPTAVPARLTGVQTNTLSFVDTAGRTRVQEWTHTYPVFPLQHALPPGSGADPGFQVRLVQSEAPTENSLWRAERQLAQPPQLPIVLETNTSVSVLNYTIKAVPNEAQDGRFPDHATFPGIVPGVNETDMAMEVLFYLEMPEGVHRFGVTSDDGFQLTSGAYPGDPAGVILAERTKSTFDGTLDLVVPQAGVYPMRIVWFQRGGGAHFEFWAQETGGQPVLVNDATSRFKAYQSVMGPSIIVESSATIEGGFSEVVGAVIDAGMQRITVPLAEGAVRYYRLRGPAALRLTSIDLAGETVVMGYE